MKETLHCDEVCNFGADSVEDRINMCWIGSNSRQKRLCWIAEQ